MILKKIKYNIDLNLEKTITRSNHESDDSINNSHLAGTDKQGDETSSQKLDKLLDQNIEVNIK
jgi:hypothetical protein